MPQTKRRVAFSAKAKKKQLQAKREEKREGKTEPTAGKYKFTPHHLDEEHAESAVVTCEAINQQPGRSRNINRYNLKFHVETKEEIEARKELARQTIIQELETSLEMGSEMCFIPGLEFPKRPKWDYSLSQKELDMRENRYFREYVDQIDKTFPLSELSYFELNLETWRQLWRVLEMSDVVVVVVDARFPSVLFPPSLYTFVTEELKREIIMVINKIDLVPASVIAAWRNYFKNMFPNINIVFFTSLPSYNLRGEGKKPGLKGQRRKGKMRMAAEGALNLLETCEKICRDKVDLTSWRDKINEELQAADEDLHVEIGEVIKEEQRDASYYEQERFQNGILTIGCIGQPNVGKSSLINALMGKKVVSVSKTPGHTKHFQTIFLTPNVKLCDCPGLVFPSKLPRTLQVLVGSYPIAHLREPYTTIGYLGKFIDLPGLLKLNHPSGEQPKPNEPLEWSAYDICEGWAIKRGFMTKRAARPDVARAANHLLRIALEGRICFYLRPPNYLAEKIHWDSHPDLIEIQHIQALSDIGGNGFQSEQDSESDDQHEKQEDESESDVEEDNIAATSSNKFALLTDSD